MTARASAGPSRGAGAPTRTSGRGRASSRSWPCSAWRSPLGSSSHTPSPGPASSSTSARSTPGRRISPANGLSAFYNRGFFPDYTPGYLYVLWLVGLVGQATGGVGDLIKLPPILADLAIGWLVWSMALELGASRRAALFGAALFVVNPVTWFDSRDVGPGRLVRRRLPAARPARAVARPPGAGRDLGGDRRAHQAPARRSSSRSSPSSRSAAPSGRPDPETIAADDLPPDAGVLDRLRAWERRTGHPIRILTTGLAGLVTAFALSLPFGLSVIEIGPNGLRSGLIEQIFSTAAGYPYLTRQRLQPVGPRPARRQRDRREPGLDLRRGHRQPGGRRRQLPDGLRDLRVHPGGRRRRGPARVRLRRRLRHRRGPARPADAPRGRDGPRGRVLRPADAGPRALPLPVLRARGDPRGVLVALAGGLRRASRSRPS